MPYFLRLPRDDDKHNDHRRPIRLFGLWLAALLACLMFLSAPATMAQSDGSASKLDAATIGELSESLNDDQKSALVTFLKALAVDSEEVKVAVGDGRDGWQVVADAFKDFGARLRDNVKALPSAVGGTFSTILDVFTSRGGAGSAMLIGMLAVVLAAGIAANFVVVKLATPWRRRFQNAENRSFVGQIKALSLRFVMELSGLAAFTIVSLIVANLVVSDDADRALIVSFILTVILITRLAASFLRFVLGPNRPDLRLVAADDQTAQSLYNGLVGLAVLIGLGFFLIAIMQKAEPDIAAAFRFWVGFAVVAWIIVVTWRARKGLTQIIKGEDENLTPGLERMASWWPTASMAIVALTWLFIQFVMSTGAFEIAPSQGAVAIALVVATPFLDTALRGIVRHLAPPMEGEGKVAEAAYHETRNSYVRIGRVLMFSLLILIIGRTLGINFQDIAEAGLGAQIAANGVQFLLVIAGGYIAWELVNLWVNRRLAKEKSAADGGHGGEGEPGGAGQSRLASVLPLLHMTLQIAIVVITVLLALSQLGFNITPLLAGAGVIGLAVGFGAQTLVKDVVSGVFFLLDDAFRLGEFIDVGGTLGSVEKISVRSLQLRDANGPVHIVPYGDISKLTNHSRDYVIMKLKFTVPFDTDLEKVRKLFKKIGQELMEKPEIAENMLAPFKSQGVADVNDIGIVLRGKFTAKPGTQWTMRKEIYSRVQKTFEENGIEFARKEVRVHLGDDDEAASKLTPEQKQTVAAAAVDAAEPKSS